MAKIRKVNGKSPGLMALIYGEPGVGKTVNTLLTAPRPILYIECDPKPVERSASPFVTDWADIDILSFDSFSDIFTYLFEEDLSKYRSIILDPFSHLINVVLGTDLEDETYEAEVFAKKTGEKRRDLFLRTRIDQAAYHTLASFAKRICMRLGQLSKEGKLVVCICHVMENPKWNRELSAAPNFVGREFNIIYPAFFDLIGLVEQRTKNNTTIYPPAVSWESTGGFLAKRSGAIAAKTKLDWGIIMTNTNTNTKTKEEVQNEA